MTESLAARSGLPADVIAGEELIWTSKGNLPARMLTYAHRWEDHPGATVLVEVWTLDDEEVKRNTHALAKEGVVGVGAVGGVAG